MMGMMKQIQVELDNIRDIFHLSKEELKEIVKEW